MLLLRYVQLSLIFNEIQHLTDLRVSLDSGISSVHRSPNFVGLRVWSCTHIFVSVWRMWSAHYYSGIDVALYSFNFVTNIISQIGSEN